MNDDNAGDFSSEGMKFGLRVFIPKDRLGSEAVASSKAFLKEWKVFKKCKPVIK